MHIDTTPTDVDRQKKKGRKGDDLRAKRRQRSYDKDARYINRDNKGPKTAKPRDGRSRILSKIDADFSEDSDDVQMANPQQCMNKFLTNFYNNFDGTSFYSYHWFFIQLYTQV